MRRWVSTFMIVTLCSSPLLADVTVTSTTTIEGAAPGMAGPGMTPMLVMRIKGLKARSDVDMNGQKQTSIIDLAGKQMIVLQHAEKTAQVYGVGALATSAKGFVMPTMDVQSKPTGRTRAIAGAQCDEFELTMAMNMSDFSASPGMPPEAVAMLKDVRMTISGSMWVAKSGPGVSDFVAFQRAAADSNMAAAFGSMVPGMQSGGLDKVLKALSSMPGLPYLTELQMKVEGKGQMVEMMKQSSGMKIKNTVTAVTTDAVSDDQFKVPADYKVVKQ